MDKMKELISYLNCPCKEFLPMRDDDPIMEAFQEAKVRGEKEGFVPVLIPQDDVLLETMLYNSDPDSDGSMENYHPKAVEEYRKEMLSTPLESGKELLDQLTANIKEDMEDDGFPWEEIVGVMEGGECDDRLVSYWDYETKQTVPLVLAEIPVKEPWQIFAWLPFGGWNDCPDTQQLMAVSKYWYDQHGAVPTVLTHDILEYVVPKAVSKEKAMELALEQHGFCADLVFQCMGEDGTIGKLADGLTQSTVWYFWWD